MVTQPSGLKALLVVAADDRAHAWSGVLLERGHAVTRCDLDGADARVAGEAFDLIVVDHADIGRALELCRAVRRVARLPRPGVLLALPPEGAGAIVTALKAGADDVLVGVLDRASLRSHLAALETRVRPRPRAPTAFELAGWTWTRREPEPQAAEPVAEAAAVAAPAPPAPEHGLLAALPEAALVLDETMTVRAANPAAARLFQSRPEILAGSAIDALLEPVDRRTGEPASVRLRGLAAGGRLDGLRGTAADGWTFGCEASIAPLEETGAGRRWIVLLRATRSAGGAAGPSGSAAEAGTILLIDDEAQVRRPLRSALERRGYRVLEASDGEEGLAVHARERAGISLAVVDQRMPRMSGWEVVSELKRREPTLPVIVVSGYGPGDAPRPAHAAEPDRYLRKPFQLAELAQSVTTLLARRAG